MAVIIAGKQFWLWRAIDDEREVLDLLVQRRRDKAAAGKRMRKLLKKQAQARASSREVVLLPPLLSKLISIPSSDPDSVVHCLGRHIMAVIDRLDQEIGDIEAG